MTTTIRRTGGWCVELTRPLSYNGKQIDEIEIQPANLSHVIRWGNGRIASTLAFAAELTGLPEQVLRTLVYPDVDRFMLALTAVMPEPIRADYAAGNKPLYTSDDELPDAFLTDPEDPRYPKMEGPVRPSKGRGDPVKPLFGLNKDSLYPQPPGNSVAGQPTENEEDFDDDMPGVMQARQT